jgi:hypothetical protein
MAARSPQVPLTPTRTQAGATPVVSRTVTLKVKVVSVVPLPGEAVPSSTVIVPHVRAKTGVANPALDAANQIVSAMAPTR